MISTFHPSVLFCDPSMWCNEEYKDEFISNLTEHIDFIIKSNMKVAWSTNFLCLFWKYSPWVDDYYYEPKLTIYMYPKMEKLWDYLDDFPENECEMKVRIEGNYFHKLEKSWLVLVHKILHLNEKTFVVIGVNVENKIETMVFFCNCSPSSCNEEFPVINRPSEWFSKIDYMDICPKKLNEWGLQFKLALEMCCKKDFNPKSFKTPLENVDFDNNFKETFLSLQNEGIKRRIIKSITKLLTLNHNEAGLDGGLQEELLNKEFRIRISEGSRIHYTEIGSKKIFLKYITASKHDSVL